MPIKCSKEKARNLWREREGGKRETAGWARKKRASARKSENQTHTLAQLGGRERGQAAKRNWREE